MIRLLVAAEDGLAHRLAVHLADRCCQEVEWVGDQIDHFRTWVAFAGNDCLDLKRVKDLAKGLRIRAWGHFDGHPGAEDALLMRKLFRVVDAQDIGVDVLVVARDVDGRDRRAGFDQARREFAHATFMVVGALAEPEFEAWLVSAWQPETDAEREALAAQKQRLGFDPVRDSHQLTSTGDGPRDSKKVLQGLAGGVEPAERRFRSRSLAELAVAGAGNGIASYLAEVRSRLRERLGSGRGHG